MAPPPPVADDAAALLRAATTPAQREKAVSAILDRLATTASAPETQRLLRALLTAHAGPAFPHLLPRLTQVASVCTAPPRKAEWVGHALVDALVAHASSTSGHPEALGAAQAALLAVVQANASISHGALSALESYTNANDDEGHATTAFTVARPLLFAVLIDVAPQRAVQKLALVQTLVRAAWATQDADLRTLITRGVFAPALTLAPLSTDVAAWTVYPALVAATVDLLVTGGAENDHDALDVAQAVLRRVCFGLEHDLGVVSLLQSLLEIASAAPQAVCTSPIVLQLGALLLHAQSAHREQTLVLRILGVLLPVVATTATPRSVYLEALVVPLVAVLATHASETPPLLQRVLDAVAVTPYQRPEITDKPALGVDASHTASFLALAASADACEAWLQSLFHDKTPEIQDASASTLLLLQLGACLVDRRGAVRVCALDALERQLQQRRVHKHNDWSPLSVKLLVSTLVVLTSYRPATVAGTDPSWLSKAFQVLASLAATTTETMKIILRLIKRMSTAAPPSLEPQALHLMLLVWKQDARVYPQLENLLHHAKGTAEDHGDDDAEAELVRMATILTMCEKDPETGVEWVADVQRFLEHRSVSIVAMAVRAVTVLCVADCLDYETTVKMFVVKLKKNKIACAEDALFQQELCKLYAFGGACDFVESSPKYSARVLSDLWEYAEAEDASVRLEAVAALNSYTLEALGLCLADTNAHGDTDEDEEEEALTEQDVEENVDRVWVSLQTEQDERVRVEIENLVKKILQAESKKLAPGGASRTGTGVASAASFAAMEQRVSAAATKELKKLLPTRDAVVQQVDQVAEWCAYLLAYEPANIGESGAAAKRKDKRLRVVMGHVDEMKSILARCLSASTNTFASDSKHSSSLHRFLLLLQCVDAWNSFARKYFGRVEELAVLRTPMDAPEGHTAEVLSTLIDEQTSSLMGESTAGHTQRWLVVGAIVHQACKSASADRLQGSITKARALLRAQLQQSMEELRVFKDTTHAVDLQHLLLGLVLAYPTESSDPHIDAIVARVLPVVNNSEGSDLMRAAAILFVSHTSSLFHKDESRAEQRQRIQSGMECTLGVMLRSSCSDSGAAIAKLFSDTPDISKLVDHAKASSSTASPKSSPVLAWASAIGLAQLSHRFAAVHRLTWLDNVRLFLESVWREDATLCGAIALGPVLLESVHHNRISISVVQEFTSSLQRRLEDAPAESVVVGAIVLPFVIQRVSTYGLASAREDSEAFLQALARGQDCASAPILLVAAGNLLHGSIGVTLAGAATSPEREVAVETTHVERLIAALNEFKKQTQTEVSTAATFTMAAITDRVDSFYVGQKNKTFDVQVNALPATSLVFQTLEFLRSGGGTTSTETTGTDAVMRASQSVLHCVAHASRSFPLPLDLAALALRVVSRYAMADDVLAACIDFAASHASGITLLMTDLLSPERLLNYSASVVDACVDAVVTARGRLTSQQLVTLLTRTFDALGECWRRDGADCAVSHAFEKWIKLVGSLVETRASKPDEAAAAAADDEEGRAVALTVTALVQSEFMTKLPFTPDHGASVPLLRQYASDVLSKIAQRNAVIDSLSASPSKPGDVWAWWRAGVAMCELLRLGAVVSSSVIFRWLLRLDFSSIQSTSVVDVFMVDLVDAIWVGAGKKSAIEVNEPWLLELLDAIPRTTSEAKAASTLKRHVFYATVENVLAWTELRGHETLVLRGALGLERSAIAASLPALAARALLAHHHERSTACVSIAQRLWTLETSGGVREAHARDTLVRELYMIASEARPPLLSRDTQSALVAQLSTE